MAMIIWVELKRASGGLSPRLFLCYFEIKRDLKVDIPGSGDRPLAVGNPLQ
jgi:hypothetical protein